MGITVLHLEARTRATLIVGLIFKGSVPYGAQVYNIIIPI